LQSWRAAMEHCVGLDVSLKQTAICIVDRTGKIQREGIVSSDPEAIAAFIKSYAPNVGAANSPYSITSSARASSVGGIVIPGASACNSSPEPATGSNLSAQPNTKLSHTLLQSILTRLQFSPNFANLCKLYVPFFFLRKTNLE
jgi:predicted NBD/HSP70 family sugar kinase